MVGVLRVARAQQLHVQPVARVRDRVALEQRFELVEVEEIHRPGVAHGVVAVTAEAPRGHRPVPPGRAAAFGRLEVQEARQPAVRLERREHFEAADRHAAERRRSFVQLPSSRARRRVPSAARGGVGRGNRLVHVAREAAYKPPELPESLQALELPFARAGVASFLGPWLDAEHPWPLVPRPRKLNAELPAERHLDRALAVRPSRLRDVGQTVSLLVEPAYRPRLGVVEPSAVRPRHLGVVDGDRLPPWVRVPVLVQMPCVPLASGRQNGGRRHRAHALQTVRRASGDNRRTLRKRPFRPAKFTTDTR